MGIYTGDNSINVARKHLGHVGHGLSDTQTNLLTTSVEAVAPQLMDAHLEASPGAQRRLFEEQGNGATRQGIGRSATLHSRGPLDDGANFRGTEVSYV